VNDEAAEVLASVVVEMAGTGDILIDAYCGAGFFAKKLTGVFHRVIGLDWDERSINCAREAAAESEQYLAGDTALLLPEILAAHPGATILLDPPAQGLGGNVMETLLSHRPPRIVYVSCDPATLARDLSLLGAAYTLRRAVPVDMFAQTASIETACLLELRQD
jgi:23S rRNA (uracil1939-C5)-methyltransferase